MQVSPCTSDSVFFLSWLLGPGLDNNRRFTLEHKVKFVINHFHDKQLGELETRLEQIEEIQPGAELCALNTVWHTLTKCSLLLEKIMVHTFRKLSQSPLFCTIRDVQSSCSISIDSAGYNSWSGFTTEYSIAYAV